MVCSVGKILSGKDDKKGNGEKKDVEKFDRERDT